MTDVIKEFFESGKDLDKILESKSFDFLDRVEFNYQLDQWLKQDAIEEAIASESGVNKASEIFDKVESLANVLMASEAVFGKKEVDRAKDIIETNADKAKKQIKEVDDNDQLSEDAKKKKKEQISKSFLDKLKNFYKINIKKDLDATKAYIKKEEKQSKLLKLKSKLMKTYTANKDLLEDNDRSKRKNTALSFGITLLTITGGGWLTMWLRFPIKWAITFVGVKWLRESRRHLAIAHNQEISKIIKLIDARIDNLDKTKGRRAKDEYDEYEDKSADYLEKESDRNTEKSKKSSGGGDGISQDPRSGKFE